MTDTPKRIGLVSNGLGGWRLWSKDEPGMGGRDHPDAEYILAAEHDRIVAEKDAQIAELEARSTLAERLYAAQLKHTSDDIAACSRYLCNKALEEAAKVANDKSHWAECPEWLLAGIDAYRQRVVTAIRAITRR